MTVSAFPRDVPPVDYPFCPPVTVYTDRVGLLDIDAFFAAAEILRRPDLAHRPLVVAHDHPRAVVTTASYEARVFWGACRRPARPRSLRGPQSRGG